MTLTLKDSNERTCQNCRFKDDITTDCGDDVYPEVCDDCAHNDFCNWQPLADLPSVPDTSLARVRDEVIKLREAAFLAENPQSDNYEYVRGMSKALQTVMILIDREAAK